MVNLDLSFDHFVRSFALWLAFSLYENTVFMMKCELWKSSPRLLPHRGEFSALFFSPVIVNPGHAAAELHSCPRSDGPFFTECSILGFSTVVLRHRPTGPKQVENPVFPFDFRPAGFSMTHDSCRGYVVDFCEWPDNLCGCVHGTWVRH